MSYNSVYAMNDTMEAPSINTKLYNGYITDIDGIMVGHHTNEKAKTGCTAILIPNGAVVGSDVRGGAPGTREIALTKTGNLIEKIHAVTLSGGSAFGLASASGVMNYLEQQGIGFDVGVAKVPIVCGAVIFDLSYGASDIRPTEADGYEAAKSATKLEARQGSIGAGTGATVGKTFGNNYAQRSGLGSATVELPNGVLVSALVIVNALGDVYDEQGNIIRGANKNGKFLNTVEKLISGEEIIARAGTNTTIGVVATNVLLTKEEANKMASVAQNGLAIAIRPVHTMRDGDTIFALSVGNKKASTDVICLAAQIATQRAIINAVSNFHS